nr:ATP-binding protein [Myxococcus sp. MH1]
MKSYLLIVRAQGAREKLKQGTGWLVRPDIVVTAFHVVGVEGCDWFHRGPYEDVTYHLRIESREVALKPLVFDSHSDVALLRLSQAVPESVVALAPKEPERHARWHGIGYPGGIEYPGIHHGEPFALSGLVTNASVDASERLQLTIDQRTQVVWEGVSGSPVCVDERVVGVLTDVTEGADTAWAAPVAVVKNLAQQCGVTADQLNGQSEHAPDVHALTPSIPATAVLRAPNPLETRVRTELLQPEWFRHRFAEVKADLDQRYKPELHVDVNVQHAFDALARNSHASERFKAGIAALTQAWQRSNHRIATRQPKAFSEAESALRTAVQTAQVLTLEGLSNLNLDKPKSAVEAGLRAIATLRSDVLEKLRNTGRGDEQERDDLVQDIRGLDRVAKSLDDLKKQVDGPLYFAVDPFLVLTGEAGIGKSHLLTHLTSAHLELGAPALLLLGQYFVPGNPWQQIINHLGLDCAGADELLSILDATAQASGHRALLVIDALNEHGRDVHRMWRQNLAGMRATVRRYPNVSLAISVRTFFEEAVLPEALRVGPHLVNHRGFAGRETDAVTRFFAAFQLPPPRTPLLLPEYSNPLFLLLYCEAMRARTLAGEAPVVHGFIDVLDAWLSAKAKHVDDRLNTDPYDHVVRNSVEALASELAKTGEWAIPHARAKIILTAIHPAVSYNDSLLKALIDEGIVVETIETESDRPLVRFQYERIRDHLVARALIRQHLDQGGSISSLASRDWLVRSWEYEPGLLQALSVILPTEHGVELIDIAPHEFRIVAAEETLNALPWRPGKSITSSLINLVLKSLVDSEPLERWDVLKTLLLIAAEPGHPLNARLLHSWLTPMSMPDRDAVWSTALLTHHSEDAITDGLIRWVQTRSNFNDLDDEVLYLLGLALGWFLTTSQRSLRDRSTKALVQLFSDRLATLETWLADLSGINDLYATERVLAVAYGAIVRSKDLSGIGRVASAIYERWFEPGPPPVHLLARDYARNILEHAMHLGAPTAKVDMTRVRPPYNSKWEDPSASLEELKQRFGSDYSQLVSSMVEGGDFDRYIVGSNTWNFPWWKLSRTQPAPPADKEVISTFETALSPEQLKAWANFRKLVGHFPFSHFPSRDLLRFALKLRADFEVQGEPEAEPSANTDESAKASSDEEIDALWAEIENAQQKARQELERLLSVSQQQTFNTEVLEALAGRFQRKWAFPLELVQRQLLQNVLELGWDEAFLGALDQSFTQYTHDGRTAHKAERIGKKYQWLALHRLLAVVSDNFVYRGGLNDPDGARVVYDGPWQVHRRDIDPTCLLSRTQSDQGDRTTTWWSPSAYDIGRNLEPDDQRWLADAQSLPDPRKLLEVRRSPASPTFLAMDAHREWREALPSLVGDVPLPQRTIYYWIRAYLVRAEHAETVFAWAKQQDFFGRWMPETREETPQLMLRERIWSPAWRCFNIPWHCRPGWSNPRDARGLPHPVLPTWDYYLAESTTHDCSIEEAYTLHLPCPELVEMLNLEHSPKDGHFCNSHGEVVAFDPSITETGPGALLFRADQLDLLRRKGFEVLWTLFGEQQVFEVVHGLPDTHIGTVDLSGAFVRRANGWEGCLSVKPLNRDADRAEDAAYAEDNFDFDDGKARQESAGPSDVGASSSSGELASSVRTANDNHQDSQAVAILNFTPSAGRPVLTQSMYKAKK